MARGASWPELERLVSRPSALQSIKYDVELKQGSQLDEVPVNTDDSVNLGWHAASILCLN